jgi:hypothetical protein
VLDGITHTLLCCYQHNGMDPNEHKIKFHPQKAVRNVPFIWHSCGLSPRVAMLVGTQEPVGQRAQMINLLRIKGLYMFRALLAHLQEALHKRHLVYSYCVRFVY